MPAAEVDIDESLVRSLLAEQRPDLADRHLVFLAFGWDNVSVLLEPDLVARLPRREVAVDLIRNEARWLPILAPRLSLPVPVPVYVGSPGSGYPWMWSISNLVPGTSVATAPTLDLVAIANQLGEFLRELHRTAPSDAPENPYRGGALAERDGPTRDRLEMLASQVDRAGLERAWQTSVAAPVASERLWLHGDLHPHNLLQVDGRLSGVVDFGDITSGDPATDLAIGWSLFDSGTRPTLWEAYGGLEGATELRARGWAIALGCAYLAHSNDNPTMAAVGRHTLDEVLSDV